MKDFKTEKGILIDAISRKGEPWEWEVEGLVLGRVYEDGSFAKLISLSIDERNTFQINFRRGSDLAYSFLPECAELLDIMKEGLTGRTLGMIAEELLNKGWKEVAE